MDAKTPIPYIENMDLIQGEKYVTEYGIQFTYDPLGSKEKPYMLNNGIKLNHIPTKQDAGTNNLKPLTDYNYGNCKEVAKSLGAIGGYNSGKTKQKRRTFKESAELFLSLKASKRQIDMLPDDIKKYIPSDVELTQEDLILIKGIQLAQDGSDKHSVFIRDTIGEKPSDSVSLDANIITDNDRMLLDKVAKRLQDN